MLVSVLTALVLPTLLLASPTPLNKRDDSACTPTSYSISNFTYKTDPTGGTPSVHFSFQPTFSNPSIIEDAALSGATCDASSSAVASFPNESVCSTGRASLLWGLRASVDKANFNIVHQWKCNGQSWMSSTPHTFDPLKCTSAPKEGTTCDSTLQVVTPQNVRHTCSTPTCQ